MKLCVVLNASAGSLIGLGIDKVKAEIEAGFRSAGCEIEVRTPEGRELVAVLEDAAVAGFDAIVVGGGDGTIATAADICSRTDVPLGVLPLGTMNMLAKDLDIPLTLGDAIRALGRGEIRHIDIGVVNGETFLCNSTLGLVPVIGQERENQRGKPLSQKVPALMRKVLHTAWFWPGLRIRLEHDGGYCTAVTRLLTVANNAYEQEGGGFLKRASLDQGILTAYLSRHRTRLGLLWFSLGLVLHFWKHDRRLQIITTRRLTVRGRNRRSLMVSNDGEMKDLTLPLQYEIRPGALKVLAPSAPEVEAAAERGRFP
jgi:diacylglycerol kinase family enzyme